MTKIGHSESFWTTFWEKIGKGAEQPNLGVLNNFIPLWWEKIGKK